MDHCRICGSPLQGSGGVCQSCSSKRAQGASTQDPPEAAPYPEIDITGPGSSDRYHDLGEIARGGMGAIREVEDLDLGRLVAKKVLLDNEDRGMLARFVEEAQVTGQLQHPNIVPVHEIGREPGGAWYFTMKMVEGRSLARAVLDSSNKGGGLKPGSLSGLLDAFVKVCDAVAYAHSRGVIHRDLKPDNVMVGNFGEVLVMDWGLAKVRGSSETGKPGPGDLPVAGGVTTVRSVTGAGRTLVGNAIGTPAYMAPEQALGLLDSVDEKTDIWALGGILYFILCAKDPYDGPDLDVMIRTAGEGYVVPPSRRTENARIPRELEAICLKAMSREKEDRYRSVQAMLLDIEAFRDRRLVSAYRYNPFERIARWVQRHPTPSVASGVFAVLFLAGAGLTSFFVQRARILEMSERQARDFAHRQMARADAAEDGRETAEALLSKGRIVSKTMREADAEFGGMVRTMKRAFHSGSPAAAAPPDFERVDAFCRRHADDPAQMASALAAKGWLLRLSGDSAAALEAFDASKTADRDVAVGWVFETMHWLDSYLARLEMPACRTSQAGLDFDPMPPEKPEIARFHTKFEGSVEGIARARVFGESTAEDYRAIVEGFRSLGRGGYAAADKGLTLALAQPESAWMREELLLARAKMRYLAKDLDGAIADADLALSTLPDFHSALHLSGLALSARASITTARGGNAEADLTAALGRFEEYTSARPTSFGLNSLGQARMSIALLPKKHPREAAALLERALADYTAALKIDPGYATALNNRAVCRMKLCDSFESAGEDGLKHLLDAEADFTAALALDAAFAPALLNRANVRRKIALKAPGASRDPIWSLEDAERDVTAALAIVPRDPDTLDVLGAIRSDRAQMQTASGEDPTRSFEGAIEAYSGAVEARPRFPGHLVNRGCARLAFAKYESARGRDPDILMNGAIADFTQALEIDPSHAIAANDRGMAFFQLAKDAAGSGRPFDGFCARAAADFARAVDSSPSTADYACNKVQVLHFEAEQLIARGKDPSGALEKCGEEVDRLLSTWRTASTLKMAARFHLLKGLHCARTGKDPAADFGKAVEFYSDLLLQAPRSPAAYNNRGQAILEWALFEERAGRDGAGLFMKAAADFDSALAVNPRQYEARMNRGTCRLRAGLALAAKGGDGARALLEASLEDLSVAAERLRGMWWARMYRAEALEHLGRFEEAIDELHRAAEMQGADGALVGKMRERVESVADARSSGWMLKVREGVSMARASDFGGAAAALEEGLAQAPKPSGVRESYIVATGRFELARSLAMKALEGDPPVAPGESGRLLEEAVSNLRLAVEAGFADIERARSDRAFKTLRETESFRALMSDMEKRAKR